MRWLFFLIVIVSSHAKAAEDIQKGDWSVEAFRKHQQVVTGPQGVQSKQLRFWEWEDHTLLDLRGSVFQALENGPFTTGKLPDAYPSGDALKEFKELPGEEKYPVSIKGRGSRNILVLGGRVIGQQPRELPWRIMKQFYDGDGIRIEASGALVVDGMYIENTEDGFSPRGDGYWILRNAHMRYIRDDFVENDWLLSGEISNCLADGVFVFLSNRPGKTADPAKLDALTRPHVVIRDTLVHLQPMPHDGDMKLGKQTHIVDGKAPGKLFKWSPWGGTVAVSNCIFRFDAMAASGKNSMSFPAGTYSNVTVVWTGKGEFPAALPDGITLTRDIAVWTEARNAWLKKNGR